MLRKCPAPQSILIKNKFLVNATQMSPAPQSVLIKNKFLVNAAQMSLTLRNFMVLLLKLKRHKVSDFNPPLLSQLRKASIL